MLTNLCEHCRKKKTSTPMSNGTELILRLRLLITRFRIIMERRLGVWLIIDVGLRIRGRSIARRIRI